MPTLYTCCTSLCYTPSITNHIKGNEMIQTFQVQNVKCGGCAHTLKEKLTPIFGEITVDLSKEPREITLEIEDDQQEILAKTLRSIGYPLVGEEMGVVETAGAKAKSFVSCAIGKIGQ